MKRLTTLIALLLITSFLDAQTLTAPIAQGVYGGRVNAITGYPLSVDSTRVIISTESSNSLFYADVHSSLASSSSFGNFTSIPGANDNDGFGGNVNVIAAHEGSGYVFFEQMGNLYKVSPVSGSATMEMGPGINDLAIEGNHLLALEGNLLHFGQIDASANYTAGAGSPINFFWIPLPAMASLILHPLSSEVYIFGGGTNPTLYMSNVAYSSLSSSSIFSSISLASISSSNVDYRAFGIAPDGRLYIMGNHYPVGSNISDYFSVAYSDDNGNTWSTYRKPFSGPFAPLAGPNIDFSGNSSNYWVYNGDSWNSNNGDSLSWNTFGTPGGLHHNNRANSGTVWTDPNNDSIVFYTTNQGFGYSNNYGSTSFGMNNGITATQVNDMDMSSDFNVGWVASKSGVRKVSSFKSTPSWGNTMFPNGDGSPYFSIDMANDDSAKAYAGNVRIYKTSNSGASWDLLFDPTSPLGGNIFPPHGTQCNAIEINPWDTSMVLAGFANDQQNHGGLFISIDGGKNWSQILIEAPSNGEDVDVYDIVFTDSLEAYIGVSYDLSNPQGRSIYKVNLTSNTATQEMTPSGTATGSSITASIYDLELSPNGDTIFAAGTDAGINHPIAYYKDLSGTGLWTVISTSGFPTGSNDVASALTIGDGVVFCAVNHEIYTWDLSSSASWTVGYSYSVGTKINFLFYDELLAGTGTGLYAQNLNNNVGIEESKLKQFEGFTIYPNPSTGEINIRTTEPLYSLTINDLSGKAVYKNNKVGINAIKLDLPSGIYLIKAHTSSRLFSQKIIIE